MFRLIVALGEIALHRRGPDCLPASSFLLALVLAADVAVAVVRWWLGGTSVPIAPLLLVDITFTFAFLWIALKAFHRETRFRQTATAIFGTETLLNVLSTPLVVWLRDVQAAKGDTALAEVFLWLVILWAIDISGFVLARSLERPYVLGVAIVLGYALLSTSLRVTLFRTAG